jgi:hypothetical protein
MNASSTYHLFPGNEPGRGVVRIAQEGHVHALEREGDLHRIDAKAVLLREPERDYFASGVLYRRRILREGRGRDEHFFRAKHPRDEMDDGDGTVAADDLFRFDAEVPRYGLSQLRRFRVRIPVNGGKGLPDRARYRPRRSEGVNVRAEVENRPAFQAVTLDRLIDIAAMDSRRHVTLSFFKHLPAAQK